MKTLIGKDSMEGSLWVVRGGFGSAMAEPDLSTLFDGMTTMADCTKFCTQVMYSGFRVSMNITADTPYYARCYPSADNSETLGANSMNITAVMETLPGNINMANQQNSISKCVGIYCEVN